MAEEKTEGIVPKKAEKNTKVKGIFRILLITALMYVFLLGFALVGLFAADAIGIHPMYEDAITSVFGNLGLALTAFITCRMVKKQTGERLSQRLIRKPFSFLLVIVLTVTAWSLSEVSDHIMGLILSNFMSIKPDDVDMSGIWDFLSTVVCAPIFEEIIFRFGYIGLLKRNSGKGFTLVFTTLIFAAAHTYNLQNTADVFMGTLLCAYVYYRTENLLYTIGEHALHNLLCYIPLGKMHILGTPFYYEKNGFILAGTPWLLINLTLLFAGGAWLIWFFGRVEGREE